MRLPDDRGEGAAGYLAVILLIATVAGVVVASGIPRDVVAGIKGAVCGVAQDRECVSGPRPGDSSTAAPVDDGKEWSGNPLPVGRDEWGNRPTDGLRKPPDPTEEEIRRGKEVAEQVRDRLDDDDAWYKPWTWGEDGSPDPRDALSRMSPGELDALFGELSDEEIRRLLDMEGVPEILKVRADQYLLRRLEEIKPHSIEPSVPARKSGGNGSTNPITRHEYMTGPLFGKSGRPSLVDVNQGALGDCWWMAGLGALAYTDKGREVLEGMITQNANGTYTVRFPDGESVTVTSSFVRRQDGSVAYAQPAPALWPLIMEKALAEKEGGYKEIDGGRAGEGMEILTGKPSSEHDAQDVTRSDLERWLKEGKAVTVATFSKDGAAKIDAYQAGRIYAYHSYVVRGFTGDGKVLLYNPWGYSHASVTMEEFNNLLRRVDVNDIR
ncbi:C2 family cysteine protease [Actinomadura viridis]|uniref:C2 family cysteine protease n=1 Tax=Actinomadura viridis TaxID=58110 RepID=UPI0036C00ADA